MLKIRNSILENLKQICRSHLNYTLFLNMRSTAEAFICFISNFVYHEIIVNKSYIKLLFWPNYGDHFHKTNQNKCIFIYSVIGLLICFAIWDSSVLFPNFICHETVKKFIHHKVNASIIILIQIHSDYFHSVNQNKMYITVNWGDFGLQGDFGQFFTSFHHTIYEMPLVMTIF